MQDGHDTKIIDKGYTRYLQAKYKIGYMICASDVIDNIQEHQGSIGKEWMDDGEWAGG